MYKNIFNILGVHQGCYVVKGSKLFFVKGEEFDLFSCQSILDGSIRLGRPYYGMDLWGNYIHKRKSTFFDTTSCSEIVMDGIILKENEDLALLDSEKDRLLYTVVNDKEDTFSFRLYSLNGENLDFGTQISSPCLLYGKYIIGATSKSTSCYEYDTGVSQVWQHTFTDLLQHERAILHSPIIEHKGKLYFFLDGAENRRTFCLDIETGEVLYQYNALQGWLVKDGDYLYSTEWDAVIRLNTQTHEIVHWKTQGQLEAAGLGSYLDYSRYAVQDGLVYFTQSMGVEHTTVGILDFNNRELLWYHQFEDDMVGAIGSIQVHDNRLYVHTQDNTLHVFEREG